MASSSFGVLVHPFVPAFEVAVVPAAVALAVVASASAFEETAALPFALASEAAAAAADVASTVVASAFEEPAVRPFGLASVLASEAAVVASSSFAVVDH